MNKEAKLVHASGSKEELVQQCSYQWPAVQDIFAYHSHVSSRYFLSLLRTNGDWSCSSNLYLNFTFKNYRCTSQSNERIQNCHGCSLCNTPLLRSEIRQETER